MALPPTDDPRSERATNPGTDPPGPPVVPAVLRVALYLLFVIILLSLGVGAAIPVVAPDVVDAIESDQPIELGLGTALAVQALLLPLVLLGTAFFVRRVDHRRLAWIGVALPAHARGVAVVASLLTAATPVAWLILVAIAGTVRLGGLVPASEALPFGHLILLFGGFLAAAFAEEIMLRGYMFTVLGERYRFVNAAGASAAVFALLHWSEDVGPVALINTFLLGLLLGALRYRTGSIVPGVAIHSVWNVVVACVFSLPLSGMQSAHLFAVEVTGNDYATGGSYGPEASLLLTGILVPLVFLSVLWASDVDLGDGDLGDDDPDDNGQSMSDQGEGEPNVPGVAEDE